MPGGSPGISCSLLLYLRLSGKAHLDFIFPERESRTVYPSRQGMEDLARLDCAEYRIRTVYPYDFPELAADPGIRIRNLEFCILTARVTAGYDLYRMAPLEVRDNCLILHLGKPIITSLTLDDGEEEVRTDSNRPGISATPGEWGRITEGSLRIIEQIALDRGIMEEAERFARDFMLRLYGGAGYDQIIFAD